MYPKQENIKLNWKQRLYYYWCWSSELLSNEHRYTYRGTYGSRTFI